MRESKRARRDKLRRLLQRYDAQLPPFDAEPLDKPQLIETNRNDILPGIRRGEFVLINRTLLRQLIDALEVV